MTQPNPTEYHELRPVKAGELLIVPLLHQSTEVATTRQKLYISSQPLEHQLTTRDHLQAFHKSRQPLTTPVQYLSKLHSHQIACMCQKKRKEWKYGATVPLQDPHKFCNESLKMKDVFLDLLLVLHSWFYSQQTLTLPSLNRCS